MKKSRIVILVIAALLLVALLLMGGLYLYGRQQLQKVPGLSFREALEYTTHGRPDVRISVGVIENNERSWKVYGEDGRELAPELHRYEIGSIGKTFTAALIQREVEGGRLSLDRTIDTYLKLPTGRHYPTLEELLTHTSGYRGFYFESPMIGNFLGGRNDFHGITGEMVLSRLSRLNLKAESHAFNYSNFGYAVLGLVLEAVSGNSYTDLLRDFVQQDLGLTGTEISMRDSALENAWDWQAGDAYLAAGALSSNIQDMLAYAALQLDDPPLFSACHESRKSIAGSRSDYELLGIHMDEIGLAWTHDNTNGMIWHNGATGHYNSYLAFCPERGTAVVVLSNLSPRDRIPATVLGIKLMAERSADKQVE
ncbi:MAG: serine hydrolase domain-containing protein [Bacillota bacterium]|nr:serine hydrolase domain-containing protein [Bacillota bacterium]